MHRRHAMTPAGWTTACPVRVELIPSVTDRDALPIPRSAGQEGRFTPEGGGDGCGNQRVPPGVCARHPRLSEAPMTTAHEAAAPGAIRSLIPARIDRLPWSPFHTRMVVALGVAWILDGLEITVASAVVAQLTSEDTLGLTSTQAGLIATVYLI